MGKSYRMTSKLHENLPDLKICMCVCIYVSFTSPYQALIHIGTCADELRSWLAQVPNFVLKHWMERLQNHFHVPLILKIKRSDFCSIVWYCEMTVRELFRNVALRNTGLYALQLNSSRQSCFECLSTFYHFFVSSLLVRAHFLLWSPCLYHLINFLNHFF